MTRNQASKEPEPAADGSQTVYMARTSGTIRIDGKRRDYSRGRTVVFAGDPILREIPDKFVPVVRSPQMDTLHTAPAERA